MGKAGIDTGIWKPHSTRGASTSKAHAQGVSVKEILDSANWTNVGTFQRFYRRPIEGKSDVFSKTVLKLDN